MTSLRGLGVIDPNMIVWRQEHVDQLRADFTNLKRLAATVPPLQQATATALVAQWNVWTTQAIADVAHATTPEEITAATEFYMHKIRAWRRELLALGAHESTASTSLPVARAPVTPGPGVAEEAAVVEAGMLNLGGVGGYVIFGAIVLYLGTGLFIATRSRATPLASRSRRVRFQRRR